MRIAAAILIQGLRLLQRNRYTRSPRVASRRFLSPPVSGALSAPLTGGDRKRRLATRGERVYLFLCKSLRPVERKYHGRYNREFASSTSRSYLPAYFCRDLLTIPRIKLSCAVLQQRPLPNYGCLCRLRRHRHPLKGCYRGAVCPDNSAGTRCLQH